MFTEIKKVFIDNMQKMETETGRQSISSLEIELQLKEKETKK